VLSFPVGFKIYLALDPVDMRKQFNGLWACATERLREDPRQGAVFVFTNRGRDRIKLLYWDGTGVWVLAKRLEKGRFSWPSASGPKLVLSPAELTLLLAGIDLDKTSKKSWYKMQ
jgi:transposase